MANVQGFLLSPLMTWMQTFSTQDSITLQDVCDCVFFNDVLIEIDQRDVTAESKLNRSPADQNAKLQNWDTLLRNIKSFYTEVLHQTVVVPNPDILALVEDGSKATCLEDIECVMLLLLGCAVQCDRKAHYIARITTSLDVATQQAIVTCIQQITDSADLVISQELISGDSDVTKQIYSILQRVVKERDELFEKTIQASQEKSYMFHEFERKRTKITPPTSLEKYQLTKELHEARAEITSLTEELEERLKELTDVKEELEQQARDMHKLNSENLTLLKDAKLVRTYRDELDSVKEQALKIEKYEKELAKFKEKNHEMEYLKTRVEELRDDNAILSEAKQKLEDHAASLQKKSDAILQDFLQLQIRLDEMKQEKEEQQKKLEETLEENAALDFERSRSKEGYPGPLRRMISCTSAEFLHGSNMQLSGHPISEELSDSMTSHVTRLEMENERLRSELEEIKNKLNETQVQLENVIRQSEKDYARKLQEFAKEQGKLNKSATDAVKAQTEHEYETKLRELLANSKREKEEIVQDFTAKVMYLKKENVSLRKSVEGGHDCQILDLKRKNQLLQEQIDRMKLEHSTVTKLDDGEVCKQVQEMIDDKVIDLEAKIKHKNRCTENELQVKVHHIQKEKEDKRKELLHIQQSLREERLKVSKLEQDKSNFERVNFDLKEDLNTLRECSEGHIKSLEQELASLQTKAVAMENLNEYLNNMSVTDENSLNNTAEIWSDENHNRHNISQDSTHSLPSNICYGRPTSNNVEFAVSNHSATVKNDVSLESCDNTRRRGERIHYVKATRSQANSKTRAADRPSGSILNKLKSYVKAPRENEPDIKLVSSSSYPNKVRKKPLQEVQVRERQYFDRSNTLRHTIHATQMREHSPNIKPSQLPSPVVQSRCTPVSSPLCRDHPLRQTMPERKTTYHFPDKRPSPSRNSSQQSLLSQNYCKENSRVILASDLNLTRDEPTYCEIPANMSGLSASPVPPNPYHAHCDKTNCCSTEFDSGLAFSMESGHHTNENSYSMDLAGKKKHNLTSIDIVSTAGVAQGYTSASQKSLVEQIVKLQDHNITLAAENSDLRQTAECYQSTSGDKLSVDKLTKLEAENRKLRMIIETLQFTLSGRNPYDKNKYHYFTNV